MAEIYNFQRIYYTHQQMANIKRALEAQEAIVLPFDLGLGAILTFFWGFLTIWAGRRLKGFNTPESTR